MVRFSKSMSANSFNTVRAVTHNQRLLNTVD